MKKIIFNPSLVIAVFFAAALIGGNALPLDGVRFFYSLSLMIKEGLLFILPFIIFAFLSSSVIGFGRGAIGFLALLVPTVMLSNGLSTFVSYEAGMWILDFVGDLSPIRDVQTMVTPFWTIAIPTLLANDQGLILGLVVGFALTFGYPAGADGWANRFTKWAYGVLNMVFLPLMPLFVGGFLLKMGYEDTLTLLWDDYAVILLGCGVIQMLYIGLFYGIGASFDRGRWGSAIKAMMPAFMTGFSTMSSASALPFTLKGVEKAGVTRSMAQSVVPATVNIHLLGDTLSTPFMALAVIKGFGGTLPDMGTFMGFLIPFVIIRFAAAAVPGGGILIVLPLFESHLQMTPVMLSVLTALYLLFDPLSTAMNVFGNGAFALFFQRLYKKVSGSITGDRNARSTGDSSATADPS